MNIKTLILVLGIASIALTSCSNAGEEKAAETSKYSYESIENDPFGLRIYTLDNGLEVYISENHAEPRIQTNIAV